MAGGGGRRCGKAGEGVRRCPYLCKLGVRPPLNIHTREESIVRAHGGRHAGGMGEAEQITHLVEGGGAVSAMVCGGPDKAK